MQVKITKSGENFNIVLKELTPAQVNMLKWLLETSNDVDAQEIAFNIREQLKTPTGKPLL